MTKRKHTKNKGAAASTTTPKDKTSKPNFNDNSAQNQRLKLLDWFFEKNSITTDVARKNLDIFSPAARVFELRKAGYRIKTVWEIWVSEFGIKHRIARYILICKLPVESQVVS